MNNSNTLRTSFSHSRHHINIIARQFLSRSLRLVAAALKSNNNFDRQATLVLELVLLPEFGSSKKRLMLSLGCFATTFELPREILR